MLWGGSFAALLVLYLFLLLPQNNMANFSKEKLAQLNREYLMSKAANSPEIRAMQNKELTELNNTLNVFVTDFDDLDKLTFSISKIAAEIRVDTFANKGSDSESYSEISTCDQVGYVDATISFRSSFSKFARFVNAVERHDPIIFVDGFTITQDKREDSRHKAEIFLNFLIKIPQENKLVEK